MANGVRVVEDGIEPRTRAPRQKSPLAWLLIGFFVGIGVGVVFLGPTVDTAVTLPETPRSQDPELPDVPGDPIGISQVVEGFPDALVAIAETQAHSLEHLVWPHSGDLVSRPLPAGDFGTVSLDQSGTWIATTVPTPNVEGFLLSLGKPSAVLPLVTGANSFSWHDRETALLSFTAETAEGWRLFTVAANREPTAVTTDPAVTGQVAAWGSWGWAIQDPVERRVALLNELGELRSSVEGLAFDSHPDGWILVADEKAMMVSAGGGVRVVQVPIASDGSALHGTLVAGSISPDGEKVALLGTQGLVVATLDGSAEPVHAPIGFGAPQVSWTSDSSFVLVPGFRGVVVVELASGAERLVLPQKTVRIAQVIPLSVGS